MSFFSHEIFPKAAKVQGFHRALYNYIELARRSNQSILKEINPEYSLEGLMLKLKLQYFGHLIGRGDSLEKTLRLGKNEGRRRGAPEDERVGWQHRLKGHEFEQNSERWWRTGKPGMLQSMGSQSQTWRLNNNQYRTRGYFQIKKSPKGPFIFSV